LKHARLKHWNIQALSAGIYKAQTMEPRDRLHSWLLLWQHRFCLCMLSSALSCRLYRASTPRPTEQALLCVCVLQGSGFETNTSASNIIDRWTREACAIIVRHNNRNSTDLPMPELPARAYCAGMASSCYVLKAVDVEMLMLPGVLKDDLRYPYLLCISHALLALHAALLRDGLYYSFPCLQLCFCSYKAAMVTFLAAKGLHHLLTR